MFHILYKNLKFFCRKLLVLTGPEGKNYRQKHDTVNVLTMCHVGQGGPGPGILYIGQVS